MILFGTRSAIGIIRWHAKRIMIERTSLAITRLGKPNDWDLKWTIDLYCGNLTIDLYCGGYLSL
jgi:hypothetical protein